MQLVKKAIFCFLTSFVLFVNYAGEWRYQKVNNGTGIVITGNEYLDISVLDIPDKIDGIPVVGIKDWAFAC